MATFNLNTMYNRTKGSYACVKKQLHRTSSMNHLSIDGAVDLSGLHVRAVVDKLALGLELAVLFLVELGEAQLLRDNNVLAARQLALSTTEGLDGDGQNVLLRADRRNDLINLHTGDGTGGLTEGTTHSSLQTNKVFLR
jgi:hypothetical protein